MLDDIRMWIVTILIGAFIVNIVDMLLPSSKLKPYINLVLSFMLIFIITSPVINFFSQGNSLEDIILKSITRYNREYVDSVNELSQKTGSKSLAKNYEDGLKEVLKLKLDEYGYELDDVQFSDSGIEKIKLKEKNSNKVIKEDIQSKENEKSQQVFKDKDEEGSLNLSINQEELKDDLVEILDVSIETIQID